MRLIDADALTIDLLKKAMDDAFLTGNADTHRLLIQVIAHYPTVDAVPVIRCRDCIRWRRSKSDTAAMVCDWDGYVKTEKDFCSWAKRKDNDTR